MLLCSSKPLLYKWNSYSLLFLNKILLTQILKREEVSQLEMIGIQVDILILAKETIICGCSKVTLSLSCRLNHLLSHWFKNQHWDPKIWNTSLGPSDMEHFSTTIVVATCLPKLYFPLYRYWSILLTNLFPLNLPYILTS